MSSNNEAANILKSYLFHHIPNFEVYDEYIDGKRAVVLKLTNTELLGEKSIRLGISVDDINYETIQLDAIHLYECVIFRFLKELSDVMRPYLSFEEVKKDE